MDHLPLSFCVTSQRSGCVLFFRELINFYTMTWNVNLVHDMFNLLEADIILNMSFKPGCMDYLVWHPSSHGNYTVYFGYQTTLGLGDHASRVV